MDDFKPLFEYVEKNIENKMGLKELADFMGYSPFYISRKFMDLYGIPVTAYVRIRKLQYSIKDLLADMKDRLVIDWGKGTINWCQNGTTEKELLEIRPTVSEISFTSYDFNIFNICSIFIYH